MQTALFSSGVGDEKGAGIPLQSSGRDRSERPAVAAHGTFVPHFVEKGVEKNIVKGKGRVSL